MNNVMKDCLRVLLMLREKIFKNNKSVYPTEHELPIENLLKLNHPMVPEIKEFDNKKIIYEHVDGITLKETNMKSVEDMMWVLSQCVNFMYSLINVKKNNLFLFAEDIHSLNLIITPNKQLKIIDLDQIGFYQKKDVYRYLNRNYFYIVDFFRCRNYS